MRSTHRKPNFVNPATLMIQGCTSDAGKSVIVAGLCRLLANRGLQVAPFKPQNMALNSAVTEGGGEIGRAQALQAVACYLEPHIDFNPILLKPDTDTGAQVIVHGKALTTMQAGEFHNYKKTAMKAVLDSHQRLSSHYQTVIVEGAGSPAEINLRDGDIANMGFAEQVDCPVVLVADIDRGGVFAHLVGTLKLLSQSEQNRVIGFIINKFRGDKKLLDPGLEWLEQETGKPVLGVIPYLHNLYLDAEDALSCEQRIDSEAPLKVVVPVLPRVSNHTDFDALRLHPGVELDYVSIEEPGRPADLIILPGSKNTISDLAALKDHNWQNYLLKHLRYGGKVLGICGGFQMLGTDIADPHGIENNGQPRQITGFGLLNMRTTLNPQKTLDRTHARLSAEFGLASVSGYEIHCGETTLNESPFCTLDSGQIDGAVNQDKNIAGTYLHGLFDSTGGCNAILNWAGLSGNRAVDIAAERERQLDRVADCLEEHLNSAIFDTLQLPLQGTA